MIKKYFKGPYVVEDAWEQFDLAPAKDENERWGYVDIDGNVKIPYQFKWAGRFAIGEEDKIAIAPVMSEDEHSYAWINEKGEFITEFIYLDACNSENKHRVMKRSKKGCVQGEIDDQGNETWY